MRSQRRTQDQDVVCGGGSCQFHRGAGVGTGGHDKSLRKVFQPHPDPLLSGFLPSRRRLCLLCTVPCSLSSRQIRRKPVNNSVPQWLGSRRGLVLRRTSSDSGGGKEDCPGFNMYSDTILHCHPPHHLSNDLRGKNICGVDRDVVVVAAGIGFHWGGPLVGRGGWEMH